MASTKLWIILAVVSRVISAQQTAGNPAFAACLDPDYQVATRLATTNTGGAVACARSCFAASYNYIYSYYQASTSQCLCSDEGPAGDDYDTGIDSDGGCQQFQYATYVTSSTFQYLGCYSGITGNNLGARMGTLESCFQFDGAGGSAVIFKPTFVPPGQTQPVSGACFRDVNNEPLSGTTAQTCDRDNAWYAYSKTPGVFVGGPSNYVKKRKRERLEREQGKVTARCPVDMTPCNIRGLSQLDEAFECIDVRSEVESCGGCVNGVFGLFDDLSTGLGVDCTALPGVAMGGVTCSQGQCVATKCRDGWTVVEDVCLEV